MTDQELNKAFALEVLAIYGTRYMAAAQAGTRSSLVRRIVPLLNEASQLATELREMRDSKRDHTDDALESIALDCAGYVQSLYDGIKADGVVRQAKLDEAAAERDAELEQEHQRIELSNMHGGGL